MYNPANTRVLHLVHNPEAEARREHEAARIGELEAESAMLRAQLQALQPKEAVGGAESMATAVAAAEKTVLEQKVSTTHMPWISASGLTARGSKPSLAQQQCQAHFMGDPSTGPATREHPQGSALCRCGIWRSSKAG